MSEEIKIDVEPEVVDRSAEGGTAPVVPTPDVPKEAKRRGRGVDLSSLDTEALRLHKAAINQKTRKKQKAQGFIFDSKDEPTKAAAKELLAARGLRHPHVIDKVYELLVREAEDRRIPANRFLFQNGIVQTLRSHEAKTALPLEAPEATSTKFVPAELLTSAELFALFDASIAAHEDITFAQFLEIRFKCKNDTYYLGKEIFRNDFSHCHEVWRDFFPRWQPATLPPEYNQRQAIEWLASQNMTKSFLLLASRRAFKSSFMRLMLVSAICTYPDLRVLVLAETRPLAKDNIEALRGYFETAPGFETRFQRLFPEFQIPVGDGSVMSLEVPTRRLKLPQSVESSSADSTVAGKRADLIVFDDFISEVSCTTEEQVKKSINKFDLTSKLLERGCYKIILGTPYGPRDAYFILIERSKLHKDETFTLRVDPAFQVKPGARHKLTPELLPSLEESDIESFLFEEGLPWKELRVDLRNNPVFFLSQNLCQFPAADDEAIKCQFTEEALRARLRPRSFFDATCLPGTPVYMSFDDSTSTSRFADFSAISILRVQAVADKPVEGTRTNALVVLAVDFGRWKMSEKIEHLTKAIEQHNVSAWALERDRGHEELILGVRKMCLLKNIPMPHVILRDIKNTRNAKALKVKILEAPLEDSRFWLVLGPSSDATIGQFVRFDGQKKSGSSDGSKDDIPDSISLGFQVWGPRASYEKIDPEEQKARSEEEERELENEKRRLHYSRMFGHDYIPIPKVEEIVQTPVKPEDPRLRLFGNKGAWRM